MNRRDLLATFATTVAAAGLPRAVVAQRPTAAISLAARATGPTIPADYVGLSYEAAQLANPDFFSPANKPLIALFRALSPAGNLRIGGGSSEFTRYSAADPQSPPPFEVFGPDTSTTVKHGTVTTALALRNLRGFLDATGWSCLYGLNFGQGTKENATAEAAAVQRLLGPRLMAVQIGNEPDSFRSRYRPADWTPADFVKEWRAFHDAIAAAAPGIRFAGPDISNKLSYLAAFADEAPRHADVILLTGHYYAMGPAHSPDATLDQLMQPDPSTATMHLSGVPVVQAAVAAAHLPFRMSEGNSCWDGGKAGVSDTLAAALWCADAMLRFAQYGWVGVNWHGGGNGHYTPIAGAPSTGFARRPEYYGIQFAQMLVGGTFIPVSATGLGAYVTCYAVEKDGRRRIVLLNKQAIAVVVTLPAKPRKQAVMLTGPALDALQGTVLRPTTIAADRGVTIPPHTGLILEI